MAFTGLDDHPVAIDPSVIATAHAHMASAAQMVTADSLRVESLWRVRAYRRLPIYSKKRLQ